MKGNVKKYKEVFSPLFEYILPYYQRGSAWSPKVGDQLKNLVDDMLALPEDNKNYFIGNILLEDLESENEINNATQFHHLDGQQRMTMISMVILCLFLKMGKKNVAYQKLRHTDGTPILTLQKEDRADFERIMCHNSLDGIEGDSKLVQCFNYICKRIKEFEGDEQKVINCIYNMDVNCLVITKEDNPQRIFARENGGGVRLTTGELIKNFLFVNNEQKYYDMWHPVFCAKNVRDFWDTDITKEGKKKSMNDVMLARFLHSVTRILCWRFKDQPKWKKNDAKELVKENNVYSSLTQFVDRFGMDKLILANEICEYGKLFHKHFNTCVLDYAIPATPCIERISCMILSKGMFSAVPYVLYVLRNVADVAERNAIFGILESYIMRLIISKNENSSKRTSEFFGERLICAKVLSADMLKEMIASIEGRHYMPSDGEIVEALKANSFKPAEMRTILYMYETKTGRSYFGINKYGVCKLIPVIKLDPKVRILTDSDIEEQKISKGLANYVLVKHDWVERVDKLKSAPWHEKKNVLKSATVGISTSKNIVESSQPMNIGRITLRAGVLAQCINERLWPAA